MEKKVSVLITDDDPGMTATLSDILVDMGYDVAVAGNGYRAIELMKQKAYGVALMDIKMPGINGVETFKEVKRINPSIRVIMMTAYSVEDTVKEALKHGAYGVIYKPLDMDKVLDLIEKAGKEVLIMVVDDDPNTCEVFKDTLVERGYKVAVGHNGEEAIKYAKENDIDIVFIDVKMPVLNGLETYLTIKEIKPEITAVMVTGYRQEVTELVEEAIRNRAYTCLYKPLDMDKVIVLVEEINRQRKMTGDLGIESYRLTSKPLPRKKKAG